ncbi:MAG: hypothetical protein QOE59_2293 [Actinomycetota bacterium]|nr:hypothetical protein [Actinomycetota bacterium]
MPFSATTAPIPLPPGTPSSRTKVTYVSYSGAPVMNRLVPFTTRVSPFRRAVVSMSVTADPWSGSDSAMAAVRRPWAMSGRYLSWASSLPEIISTEGPVHVVANSTSPAIHDFIARHASSTASENSRAVRPCPP